MSAMVNLLEKDGLRGRLATAHACNTAVPTIDTSLIKDKTLRKRADRLLRGRDALLAGHTLGECAGVAGLHQRWFERLLTRYLTVRDDGTLLGERAFLRDQRIARHPVRTKPIEPGKPLAWGACSGFFLKLIQDNQAFREALVAALRRKGKSVMQPNKVVGRELRKLLVGLYEAHGVAADEYPRCTKDKGLRALRRWMVSDFLPGYASDWIAAEHGPDAAKAVTTPQLKPTVVTDYGVYVDWMLDEVRVDCRVNLEVINAAGDPDLVERDCFHMLRVIELGYNTNLATWPVWSGKSSAYDLGNLLWRALNGWTLSSALPDLQVDAGGGFPVMALPELRWRAPRRIYLDNALAHLSAVLGVIVEHVLGAELRLGKPGDPKERPEIEGKFSLQARRLVHQVRGTTGSGPKDPQRKRFDDLQAHELVSAEALEHALSVMAANENGSPATAAHGIPPLERLRRAVLRDAIQAQPVALSHQIRHMFFPGKEVTVHVDLNGGRKPYCNFMRIRYSSSELQRRYDLNGKKVMARFDPDDLRVIILYTLEGAEICRAHGEGRWGILPHDIRMRQMSLRNIDRAALGRMPQDGPLQALLASLERDAAKSRSAAARLAHCLAVIGRHMKDAAHGSAEWVAQLLARGDGLDASLLCRPAANSPSGDGAGASTPATPAPPPATAAAATVTPMEPRNAIRRRA